MCHACHMRERHGKPNLFTAENNADVGFVPEHLPVLTEVEEMLITRVHVHCQVWQVKGQQYKYTYHVVSFLNNTAKMYDKLPLTAAELDVSGLTLM